MATPALLSCLGACRRRLPALAGAALALLLTACGGGGSSGGDGGEAPAPASVTQSATIGPSGGTLTHPDGVQVVVPPGALAADTALAITSHPDDAPPRDPLLPPGGTVYAFTPHGTRFELPVTIRFPLPPGATEPGVLMTDGELDWTQQPATFADGMASVQRLGFSWGYPYIGCESAPGQAISMDHCFSPRGNTQLTAAPAAALVERPWPGSKSFVLGAAASLQFTLHFSTWPSCQSAQVTLKRRRIDAPASSVQTLQVVNLVLVPNYLGARGAGGSVAFTPLVVDHQDDGGWDYGTNVQCQRADGFIANNGDMVRLHVGVPVPTVTLSIGGSVSGLAGSGLVLRNNGRDDLAVAADGTFAFATGVAPNAPYEVTVASAPAGQVCTVASGSGLATADVANILVTCTGTASGSQRWQPVVALPASASAGDARQPHLALRADGSGLATWVQGSAVLVSRYAPGAGWSAPQDLGSGAGAPSWPRVALDGAGRALLVWAHHDGAGGHSVRARRFEAGSWGAEATLHSGIATAPNTVRVGVDGGGHGIAVFDGGERVMASRFDPASGWGPASAVDDGSGAASRPDLTVFGSGLALAVWEQYDGQDTRIMFNRFNGSGWSTADQLAGDSGVQHEGARVAGNGSDRAMAVWTRRDGVAPRAMGRMFQLGTGLAPGAIDLGGPDTDSPLVAMNAAGDHVVAWKDRSAELLRLMARTVPAALDWSQAAPASRMDAALPDAGDRYGLCLAMGSSGLPVAVWTHPAQPSGRNDMVGNLASSVGLWGRAVALEQDDADPHGPQECALAVDGLHNALALWPQPDAAQRLHLWSAALR